MIGRPLPRVEDPRLLRGHGAYVTDMALPGLLHLAVLRSPHAHARIRKADLGGAATMRGIVATLGAGDVQALGALPVLAAPPGQRQTDFPVLPHDRVRYVGQPVAAVVAESRYVAQDALERMVMEYEPLPVVMDVEAATRADAPRLYDEWPDNVVVSRTIGSGDPDRAFASSSVRARDRRRRRSRGAPSARPSTRAPASSRSGRPARRRTSTGRSSPACLGSTRIASASSYRTWAAASA